jgi:DNA-binding PadR family transcriptional regulator
MSTARARELAVMSLLAAHPAHGYEIAKAVSSGPLVALGLTRAAVYAILDRFRARGWVEERPEPGESYPDRTVLSLTDAARGELATRLARLGEDPLPATLPLMVVMMARDMGADLPADAVTRLIAAREAALAELGADAAHGDSASARLARRLLKAELDSLRDLLPAT